MLNSIIIIIILMNYNLSSRFILVSHQNSCHCEHSFPVHLFNSSTDLFHILMHKIPLIHLIQLACVRPENLLCRIAAAFPTSTSKIFHEFCLILKQTHRHRHRHVLASITIFLESIASQLRYSSHAF